jgi:hypothetical protein
MRPGARDPEHLVEPDSTVIENQVAATGRALDSVHPRRHPRPIASPSQDTGARREASGNFAMEAPACVSLAPIASREVEMTMHPKFLRSTAAAVAVIGTSTLALAVSAQSASSHSSRSHAQPQAAAAKGGACHITQTHSIGNQPATTIRFVNHHNGPIGVYWLNFQGYLAYYETLARNASVSQKTFRSNAWVMLSSSFNCVGYVVTSGAPQYVIR